MFNKISSLAFLTALMAGCSPAADSSDGHGPETDGHGPHDEITLEAAQATRFGVQADTLRPGEFAPALRVGAEVLPSATGTGVASAAKSGIIHLTASRGERVNRGTAIASVSASRMAGGDEAAAARVAYEAAKREKERLEPLLAEGIVTSAAYNAALRDYEAARTAYSAGNGSASVTSPITGTVTDLLVTEGEYVQAGTPVARISENTRLTLKAYVPASRADEAATIRTARFTTPGGRTIEAHLVNSSVPEAEGGFIPLYFEFDAAGTVPANRPVEAWLLPAPRQGVLSLPREAVVEQQGTWWAFVKLDDDCYEKRRIEPGQTDGSRIEILGGLTAGEPVVTAGAIVVKLAESSGAVPEGHSHNH